MKQIPFYRNNISSDRSTVAIYQILFDYFLNQKVSASEMGDYIGYDADKDHISSIKPLTSMAQQGFDIRMIGIVKDEELAPHPDFAALVPHEARKPRLHDIDTMLNEDRLVYVTVNLNALKGKEGYKAHTILILQREADNFIVHDPGLPPKPYLRVSRHLLWKAMGGSDNTAEVIGFIFRKGHNRRRLDMYVLSERPRLSRAFAAKLIEDGKVTVNGKARKPGYKVQEHDTVVIDYDETELDAVPDIDLPILYEDDYCIVINKPSGVLTHAQGILINEATVATFLRRRAPDMHGERAGIVHRLDRPTSGVIVVAKNQSTLSFLQKQFADRTTKKTYIAIVKGHLKEQAALIDMPIERNPKAPATFRVGTNGKPAQTVYKVLEESAKASLVELSPRTGRTHQLRVHLAQLGHPIIGDPLYGGAQYGDRLYLHAQTLELTLPNGERKVFTAPLPPEFKEYMAA
jgi:23S rRNA pseudouridine1911/1915/1917 synthase